MATRTVRLPDDRALFALVAGDGSARFRCRICDQITVIDVDTACDGCAAVATGGES